MIGLIAAVGKSGQLGLGDHLPWHDAEDLRWFRSWTMNSVVIMGRRTFEPLQHLQGTANRIFVPWQGETPEGFLSLMQAKYPDYRIWIAGGARTYAAFLPYCRRSVITHVSYDGPATAFMPPLWREPSELQKIKEQG